MLRLLLSFFIASLAVFLTAMLMPRSTWWGTTPATWSGAWHIGVTLVGVPTVVAWIVLEVMQRVRPRRLMIGRRRGTMVLVIAGLTAGVLTPAFTGVGVAFLEGDIPDWSIVALSTLIAMLCVVLPLPRYRQGRCVYCLYDFRGVTVATAGRCPECGATARIGGLCG